MNIKDLPARVKLTVRYLTPDQVSALVSAAREHSRNPNRDAAMILLAYHHGLRVSELCGLRWDDIDLKAKTIYIARAKGGEECLHLLQTGDIGTIRALGAPVGTFVFRSELGTQMTPAAVQMLLRRLCVRAGLPHAHPHMLRHGCGYAVINKTGDMRLAQAYLGHRSPASTLRYTTVNVARFKGLF
jgi:type 1 fimbriae regulatory protein FimE